MRVFIDACVFYPPLVRTLVVGAAAKGLLTPLWSARVLEEWRRAIAAKQGVEAALGIEERRAVLTAALPDASVDPDPDLEATLALPDPADTHVLSGAISSGAEVLLTFNLRDFPARVLAGHAIEARHPDGFLWELLSTHEAAMGSVITAALAEFDIPPERGRAALKRARLSRLGKAWESRDP